MLGSAGLTWIGASERERQDSGALARWAIGMTTLLVFVWAVSSKGRGVSTADFVKGVVLGTVAVGAIPSVGCYALGRALGSHRRWLWGAWLVMQVPLGLYLFVAVLATVAVAHCPADANDCPI